MRILFHNFSVLAITSVMLDFILTILAVLVGRSIGYWSLTGWEAALESRSLVSTVLYALIVVVSLGSMGLYDSKQRYSTESAIARALIGVSISAFTMALLVLMLEFDEGRAVWISTFACTALFITTGRIVQNRFLDDEVFRRRVLVYGAGRTAASILQLRRRSDQRGFLVIGFLPSTGDEERIDDPRVLTESPESLIEFVSQNSIDEIVVAIDDRRRDFPMSALLACKLSGIRVIDVLDFLERESGRIKVNLMNPSWLIFSERFNRRSRNRISFRILDLLIAGILTTITFPLMVVISVLILLKEGRPVLYTQTRVGLNGKLFTLLKFRSMRKNAEADGAAVWANVDDARITKLGYWLRKLRLDELPQLINVIRGDMSMVGPRPERPEFVSQLADKIPFYHERHYVRPGITGWAQLSYPYGASEKDALAKLEFDMYFIKNRSLIFYLLILLQTAEVVLWQKGSR